MRKERLKKTRHLLQCAGAVTGLGICVLAGGAVYRASAPMQASASGLSSVTSDSIREKEKEIAERQKEKENLRGGLSDLKEIKKGLEQQKENLKSYVEQLDGELERIEQNIVELKQQIEAKEGEIRETEAELKAALQDEENQLDAMVVHIRMMYETGEPNMVELLAQSKSFGDFLNKADHVERVAAYDRMMWEGFKAVREYVELCKEELELEKEILDETKAGVETEQHNLEELISQKNRDITNYESDIGNKEKAIQEYEALIRAEEEEIKMLEAAVAEEKKKLLANNGSALTYDGGMFKFPMASYTAISDEYGWRTDPFLGTQAFHNGVDFAAPKGTPIYAAYDGKVVASAYSASMGNYVMIDHGDGLYTIYMHASALYVNKDDIVVAGETIAAVGTTGRSTGNHLHFSVRLNGSYVSPWDYLKQ